jgi:hypothetical protein
VEEDIEALPRHPRRRRKTPSEASPWSTVLCLAPWWGNLLICPRVVKILRCNRNLYGFNLSSSVEDAFMFKVSYHAVYGV